jgi:predicted NBD/HSP70 family sugar kinase
MDDKPSSFLIQEPAKSIKASPSDIRRNNRSLLFSLLFPNHQYSRAELGRKSGLSKVAVSDVISEMLNDGLVRETRQEAPTGSTRKAKRGTLLGIDTTLLRIISVDLSQTHLIQGTVTDLLGTPLTRAETALSESRGVEPEAIAELIKRLAHGVRHIIGVGVAVPGVVQNGIIRRSAELGWEDFNLRSQLEELLDLSVYVFNDTMSSMFTERTYGQSGPNLLFVKLDRGIGSATLIDDGVIVGENHAGGEIGHISVDVNGPACRCGKKGCLEALIGVQALRNRMEGKSLEERLAILSGAGQLLANALSMPIGLFDMKDVCIFGPPDIVNDTFCQAAQEYVDKTTYSTFRGSTRIRRCQCGLDATLKGSAIAVVRQHLAR